MIVDLLRKIIRYFKSNFRKELIIIEAILNVYLIQDLSTKIDNISYDNIKFKDFISLARHCVKNHLLSSITGCNNKSNIRPIDILRETYIFEQDVTGVSKNITNLWLFTTIKKKIIRKYKNIIKIDLDYFPKNINIFNNCNYITLVSNITKNLLPNNLKQLLVFKPNENIKYIPKKITNLLLDYQFSTAQKITINFKHFPRKLILLRMHNIKNTVFTNTKYIPKTLKKLIVLKELEIFFVRIFKKNKKKYKISYDNNNIIFNLY